MPIVLHPNAWCTPSWPHPFLVYRGRGYFKLSVPGSVWLLLIFFLDGEGGGITTQFNARA